MILEERPDDPGASEDSDRLQEDSSNPKVGAEEGVWIPSLLSRAVWRGLCGLSFLGLLKLSP